MQFRIDTAEILLNLGSTAEILSVEFDGCTKPPCNVFHGTTASGRITLRANTSTNTLTCKVSVGNHIKLFCCFICDRHTIILNTV